MTSEATKSPQVITPYLYYEDVEAALEWLEGAFGFGKDEKETMRNPEGKVVHAQMTAGEGVILMGCPSGDYKCPKRLGHVTQNLYVNVDDVAKHFERAKKAGATLLSELADTFYGDRRYGVADLEGHHWYFAETLRQVKPEDWKPTPEDMKGHA
ncbi:MAG: VOC family protein [Myxococcota bacterium]|nr:VOC family protein [Myxococcota bacterium]